MRAARESGWPPAAVEELQQWLGGGGGGERTEALWELLRRIDAIAMDEYASDRGDNDNDDEDPDPIPVRCALDDLSESMEVQFAEKVQEEIDARLPYLPLPVREELIWTARSGFQARLEVDEFMRRVLFRGAAMREFLEAGRV